MQFVELRWGLVEERLSEPGGRATPVPPVRPWTGLERGEVPMNARLLTVSLLALAAHTAAPARTIPLPPAQLSWTDPEAPQAAVGMAGLDLRRAAGAAAFRSRVDRTVVALSGGELVRNRPDVVAARARARAQADAAILAARS